MECPLSQNDDRLVRVLNCDDFVGTLFETGGSVKMTLNANFIITNQFLTSK
jgi:hypothetical protein